MDDTSWGTCCKTGGLHRMMCTAYPRRVGHMHCHEDGAGGTGSSVALADHVGAPACEVVLLGALDWGGCCC